MTRHVRVKSLDDAMRILKSPDYAHTPQVVSTLMTGLEEERPVLSVADGETWQRTHDALARFFTPAYVQNYAPVITQITDDTFAEVDERFNLDVCMRRLTTRVMWYVLFGEQLSFTEAEELAWDTGVISSTRDIVRQRYAVRNVSNFIWEKLATRTRTTQLVDSLINRFSRLDPAEANKALISELKFLIIAGVETTAASLAFTICEIA